MMIWGKTKKKISVLSVCSCGGRDFDINEDGIGDVFDFIAIRKKVSEK